MALTLNGTSGIVGAGIGTIGPSGANVTGVVTCTSVVSSGAVSGTTGTFTAAVAGTTGTFTGDVTFGANSKAKLFENGTESGVQATNSGSSAHLMTHDGNEDIHVDPGGYIKFEVAGSERVRLSGTGRLLVGTTDDTGYSNRSAFFHKSSGSNYISVTSDSSNSAGIVFGDATNQAAGNYESYMYHDNSNNKFTITTAQGTKNFNFETDGDLQLQHGNLVIGTAGKGIDFSAAGGSSGGSSSALLDDYEEGTWTPTISNGLSSLSQTFDAQGRYTKIGRQVTCQFIFQFSGQGNGNRIEFTSLPFTSVNNNTLGGGTTIWCNVTGLADNPGWGAIQLLVKKNSQTIECYRDLDDNATTGNAISNKAFYGVLSYESA